MWSLLQLWMAAATPRHVTLPQAHLPSSDVSGCPCPARRGRRPGLRALPAPCYKQRLHTAARHNAELQASARDNPGRLSCLLPLHPPPIVKGEFKELFFLLFFSNSNTTNRKQNPEQQANKINNHNQQQKYLITACNIK